MRLETKPKRNNLIYMPESIKDNSSFDRLKTRSIWTPNGEYEIPVKSKKYINKQPKMMRGVVRNIWAKDERGKTILLDKTGTDNAITSGCAFNMLMSMFDVMGTLTTTSVSGTWTGGNLNQSNGFSGGNFQPPTVNYNDGTYNFPSLQQILSFYYSGNGDTYYAQAIGTNRIYATHFGQLMLLNNSSGGLTGSHIPAVITFATGFTINWGGADEQQGWSYNNIQSPIGTTNTTITDSYSRTTSGTPMLSHSITITASAGATPFTFDGIAWVPIVGFQGQYTVFYAQGWWFGNAQGSNGIPTWASASATPTTQADLLVSALWNPGYAITINPGGSFGFTYNFLG